MKTLLLALLLYIPTYVFSQSITNTLGTNGLFTIKDASSIYLTLSQSTGQVNIVRSLRLENTTSSSLGILYKGTDSFLHNFGSNNTFLGVNSGNFTMEGFYNTAVGNHSLSSNTDGNFNVAVGNYSLTSNTTGFDNTAVGYVSLYSNTTGFQNTAYGKVSLYSNTTGFYNTAVGNHSLYANTSGSYNTAVGNASLASNINGQENVAVGFLSLSFNADGNKNTGLGYRSLYFNTDGYNNTAVGNSSLYSNTTGASNTAVGLFSLYSNTSGSGNTAVGDYTGTDITTGYNLTCIGEDAEPTSGDANNQITLGNSFVTSLRCAVTTITSLSDSRDKKNITDLPLGLDFLMKVKPRLFNWDKREWYENNNSDGSKINEAPTAGFIAQELDEVQITENAEWLNLVLKDNPDKLEATSGNLLPVMVKAIQELKVESEKLKVDNEKLKVVYLTARQESEKLKAENIELKNDDKDMKQRLLKLEQTQNKLLSELNKFKFYESKMTEVNEGEVK